MKQTSRVSILLAVSVVFILAISAAFAQRWTTTQLGAPRQAEPVPGPNAKWIQLKIAIEQKKQPKKLPPRSKLVSFNSKYYVVNPRATFAFIVKSAKLVPAKKGTAGKVIVVQIPQDQYRNLATFTSGNKNKPILVAMRNQPISLMKFNDVILTGQIKIPADKMSQQQIGMIVK